VVQVKVEPGEPVRVGEIDLVFQGFAPNPELPARAPVRCQCAEGRLAAEERYGVPPGDWETAKRDPARRWCRRAIRARS
jgi:translocation and assembly module TamA